MPRQHLADGLYRLAAEDMRQDPDFLREHGYSAAQLTVTAKTFAAFQDWNLRQTVRHAAAHSAFYRQRFAEYGLEAKQIQTVRDLPRLPYTTPQDLAGNNYNFLCISQSGIEKPVTFYSGGTTGLRKSLYFSKRDVARMMRFFSIGMNTVTARENGRIQIFMPNTSGRGTGFLLESALNKAGFQGFATDLMASAAAQIEFCRRQRTNVWFGDTRTIYRITKEMQDRVDLKSLGVEVLFLTVSQPSKAMRKTLQAAWGAEISTHYGLTEMGWGLAVDCLDGGAGYHYNELDVLFEQVDPEVRLPLGSPPVQELVFTSLNREAMPVLRYRSRDFATGCPVPCACGRNLNTFGEILTRQEDLVGLDEEDTHLIYPALFDDPVLSCPDVVDYEVHLTRRRQAPAKLQLQLELLADKPWQDAAARIEAAVRKLPPIQAAQPEIELLHLPPHALKANCYSKKRIYLENL